jgi:hypothetical protein
MKNTTIALLPSEARSSLKYFFTTREKIKYANIIKMSWNANNIPITRAGKVFIS